jgi:hypothetical protein
MLLKALSRYGQAGSFMKKATAILLLIFLYQFAIGQYTYKGNVYSVIRGRPIGFGNIQLASKLYGHGRRQNIAKIDSLGNFTFKLKQKQDVRIYVECYLAGSLDTIISWQPTPFSCGLQVVCNEYNPAVAAKDINDSLPKLLCHLGYATYKFDSVDRAFEAKYQVKYVSSADTPPWSDCMWLYNRAVAEFLDKKYGVSWRKEVRWDVPLN